MYLQEKVAKMQEIAIHANLEQQLQNEIEKHSKSKKSWQEQEGREPYLEIDYEAGRIKTLQIWRLGLVDASKEFRKQG